MLMLPTMVTAQYQFATLKDRMVICLTACRQDPGLVTLDGNCIVLLKEWGQVLSYSTIYASQGDT